MIVSILVKDERWKSRLKPYGKTVREACEAAYTKKKSCEVAVVLADDKFIRELNRTYRGKDKPTNILSFHDDSSSSVLRPASSLHLGDLILAFETIAHEAKDQRKSFKAHTQHLLVHGMLHLQGYDHEKGADAKRMESKEIRILKQLGIANPYHINT